MRLTSLGFSVLLLFGTSLPAQTNGPVYRWTTLAGRASVGSEDGLSSAARFNEPHGLVCISGWVYVADTGNHTIRAISPAGVVTTFAGQAGASGNADGKGPAARFNAPEGLATDRVGNLYVADTRNHTIRKITADGTVTTVAGKAGQPGSTDGAVASALLERPQNLSVDSHGTIYFSTITTLRKISAGTVTTVTLPTQATDLDGQVVSVYAGGLPAFDATDRPYFRGIIGQPTDTNRQPCVVRQDSPTALVVVAKAGAYTSELGWGDFGIFNDTAGNLYLTHSLRGYGGTAGFFLGRPLGADGSLGTQVGFVSTNGGFDVPQGVAVNASTGRWYYTRTTDSTIMDATSTVVAGTAGTTAGTDGNGAAARFATATELALDAGGAVWIADRTQWLGGGEPFNSYSLRRVDPTGAVTTPIAGHASYENDSASYGAIAPVSSNHLYFSWYHGPMRQMVDFNPATGTSTAVPETNTNPYPAALTELAANSNGLVLGLAGDSRIFQIAADGSRTLFAGTASGVALQDGTGAAASFGKPFSLTADANGNFYVLDARDAVDPGLTYRECYVRKITPDARVTTISKNLVRNSGAQGILVSPASLAVDSHGNLYVSYAGSTFYGTLPSGWSYSFWQPDNVIRRLTPDGDDSIIGSSVGWDGSMDGNTGTARFAAPWSLAVDRQDNLYVLDGYGTTLRRGEFLGLAPKITKQPANLSVVAGGSAVFSVTASGTPVPQYQWQRNGAAIAGATSDTLTISSAQSADGGTYTVVVSNSLGSTTSDAATLTVTAGGGSGGGGGGSGGGGGGAPSLWFVGVLGALLGFRSLRICFRRAP